MNKTFFFFCSRLDGQPTEASVSDGTTVQVAGSEQPSSSNPYNVPTHTNDVYPRDMHGSPAAGFSNPNSNTPTGSLSYFINICNF